jgi:hypothetical protein
MNKLKYILIVLVIIIVIVGLMSFTTITDSKEDTLKKSEINNMFSIWLNVSGSGDKQTLTTNEKSIKKDLFDKLTSQEVLSLKQYSLAIQDLLSSKNTPISALFLSSLAYLTQNFNMAKEIISKTNVSNVFANFGFGTISNIQNNRLTN